MAPATTCCCCPGSRPETHHTRRPERTRVIRANSLSPSNVYFKGGVWQGIEQANPEFFEQALAHNPTGRMGRPEEVARAAAFLASPAASFVTATNLVVDGALTRGVQL